MGVLNKTTKAKIDLRTILIGYRRSGKRSSQKTILNLQEPYSKLQKAKADVSGRTITVVDTPGWYNVTLKQTPELVKKQIESSVLLCLPGPHAFLLVLNVETPFREIMRRSVKEHMELFGERVWHHTVILFTHGDRLEDRTIEEHIESEGSALQWLVEKCENRYHVLNNMDERDRSQVTELLSKIERMVARKNVEPFHLVGVEDLEESDDDGVICEDDWAFYREMSQGRETKRKSSFPFVPPSFDGEKRSEMSSWCTSDFGSLKSASRRTQSSGYSSLKKTSRSDVRSVYGPLRCNLRSGCRRAILK